VNILILEHSKIIVITFLLTVILSFLIIPILKRLKIGQVVRNDGPQTHLSKQGVPTMGGIIMLISIAIMSIWGYLKFSEILPMLIVTIGFGIVGFVDDFIKLILKNPKGLKPMYKMIGLLIVSVFFVGYILSKQNIGTETLIPIVKQYWELPIYFYIPFIITVLLATTNSVNLTDGLDGLATGIVSIIVAFFTIVAAILQKEEVVYFGCLVIGACLGFLMFNLHPAKIMMGDTGSLALGGVIGAISIYLRMPIVLLIVAIVPVLEALSVIIQVAYFKKTGKRIFKMAPLHHHFELSGWKETKVVLVFWLVTLAICIVSLYLI